MSLSKTTVKNGAISALLIVVVAGSMFTPDPAEGRHQPVSVATGDLENDRPNFVVIMTDDQTVDQMSALPQVQERLASTGATFSDSIVSYPQCCPSRASMFTGQYTHNNGVDSNAGSAEALPFSTSVESSNTAEPESEFQFRGGAEQRSLAVALSNAGYRTGLLGKYFNGYGTGRAGNSPPTRVPPGWSDWRVSSSRTNHYRAVHLNINGTVTDFSGQFQTDLYADQAEDMIALAAAADQPFYLQFNFSAPHQSTDGNPMYANRHSGAFPGSAAPRPQSYDEANISDKPPFLQRVLPALTASEQQEIDSFYRNQLRSLASVDDAAVRIFEAVEAAQETSNTIFVFTSDNGLFHGEHRIPGGKFLPYEESIRVPLIIAGPVVDASVIGTTIDQPVANIDLAPTILDYAGAAPLSRADGRSLRPLLDGSHPDWSTRSNPWNPTPSRSRAILLTGTAQDLAGRVPALGYSGVRSADGWVYVKWRAPGGAQYELYDLETDPNQLDNRAGDPDVRWVQSRLERQRRLLKTCRGASCEVPPYGYLDLPRAGAPPAWVAAASWADAHSLGAAYADGTFRPDSPVRRLDLLLWMWRHAGAPTTAPDAGVVDVPEQARAAANWAIAEGIVRPGAGGTLDPSGSALRRDLILWLWKSSGRPAAQSAVALPTDVDPSSPQANAYRWALDNPPGAAGPLITLDSARQLSVRQPSTRAVAITALYELDRR